MNVFEGVRTSSPFFAPKAIRHAAIPLVQEFTATTCLTPNFFLIKFSICNVFGPGAIHPVLIVFLISLISLVEKKGFATCIIFFIF